MDVLACYNYLVQQRGVPPHEIVLCSKGKRCGLACWLVVVLCREGAASSLVAVVAAGAMGTTRTTMHGTTGSSGDDNAGARMRTPPLGGIALHSAILSSRSGGTLAAAMLALVAKDGWLGWLLPVYLLHGTDNKVMPMSCLVGLYKLLTSWQKICFPTFWAVGALSHISPPLFFFSFLRLIFLHGPPWIESNRTFPIVPTCPEFLPMIISTGEMHLNIKQKYATAYIKQLQPFLQHCNKVNGSGLYGDNRRDHHCQHSLSRAKNGDRRNAMSAGRDADCSRGGSRLSLLSISVGSTMSGSMYNCLSPWLALLSIPTRSTVSCS